MLIAAPEDFPSIRDDACKVVGADEIAGGGRIIGPNPMDSANQEPESGARPGS